MIRNDFCEAVINRIHDSQNDIMELWKLLLKYKEEGINQSDMLENLTLLREKVNAEEEDIILDLMDFVVGFCNSNLKIY